MNEIIASYFLRLKSQLVLLHWQTTSYARHMAYGRVYDAIEDIADRFIEAYQGKYERVQVNAPITLTNIQDEEINTFVEENIQFLVHELPDLVDENDVDLLAIRDEVVEQMNLLKYLLSLK